MINRKKSAVAALTAACVVALSGCSTTTDPDEVGLYYAQGSSDGNHFDHCTVPGNTDDAEWNNDITYLSISLRTWNIAPDHGDSSKATVVSTKPEPGQPSGVQVSVWSTTNFYLNTYCDDKGGVVRDFWEKIGRRYGADRNEGWANMLNAILVPALNKATQDVVRSYGSDELVGNIGGVRAAAQDAISTAFATELKRLTGGNFFCGPKFDRTKPECPEIEMIIVDVDFTDGGIQEARNQKQKAVELAAAKVAEAQGQVDAAKKLNELYANPAWMTLELAKIHLEEVKACAANPTCTIIFDGSGNAQIHAYANPRK